MTVVIPLTHFGVRVHLGRGDKGDHSPTRYGTANDYSAQHPIKYHPIATTVNHSKLQVVTAVNHSKLQVVTAVNHSKLQVVTAVNYKYNVVTAVNHSKLVVTAVNHSKLQVVTAVNLHASLPQ